MFTMNSTYNNAIQRLANAEETQRTLRETVDAKNLELTKTKSALTLTTRQLEQATDDVKAVTKEYKDLKRAVKGDFKKVFELCDHWCDNSPKNLWTHSSGRPIPLAESKISKMTFAIDSELEKRCSSLATVEKESKRLTVEFEKVQRAQEEIWNRYSSDEKAWKKEKATLTKIAAKTDEDNKSLTKVIEQGQRRVLTLQNDLIKAQKDVTRIKDLLLCSEAENTKLKQELDSRFCRFVDTLSGGGKKRKLGSSSSTLRLRDSEGD